METFKIRMISLFNEYNGYINVLADKSFYGIVTEGNYDNEMLVKGKVNDKRMNIDIFDQDYNKPILATTTEYFPKKSVVPSVYYEGMDRGKPFYIELTDIKAIGENLEKAKVYSKTL